MTLVRGASALARLHHHRGPHHGWSAPRTLAASPSPRRSPVAFVLIERRRSAPDARRRACSRTPAFSAASGAVTVAFFALFGFIFLITQYFQFIRGYGTLSTGVRILPVALSIAVASVVGTALAGRIGTRVVVVTGLAALRAAVRLDRASSRPTSPTRLIAAQMILMGIGLGLTTAPATESILGVLPPAKAGVGSAVNDATREVGGTLGVAIIGSVFSSIYLHRLAGTAVPPARTAGGRRPELRRRRLVHRPAGPGAGASPCRRGRRLVYERPARRLHRGRRRVPGRGGRRPRPARPALPAGATRRGRARGHGFRGWAGGGPRRHRTVSPWPPAGRGRGRTVRPLASRRSSLSTRRPRPFGSQPAGCNRGPGPSWSPARPLAHSRPPISIVVFSPACRLFPRGVPATPRLPIWSMTRVLRR